MPGQGAREWRFYIQDMIEFSEKVLSYAEGLDRDAFIADELTYDATLRNLELIGEAATHIPSEVRAAYPDIPWHAIVGTRNRLAHSYLSISNRYHLDNHPGRDSETGAPAAKPVERDLRGLQVDGSSDAPKTVGGLRHQDASRMKSPRPRKPGRIAVKVINHLGTT